MVQSQKGGGQELRVAKCEHVNEEMPLIGKVTQGIRNLEIPIVIVVDEDGRSKYGDNPFPIRLGIIPNVF